jgi:serine/threonine-protein kinase
MDSNPQSGPPVPHHEDLTGKTIGRFTVRARLGAGGMGEVYLAEDTRLKRPVALKRLAPKLKHEAHFRERFMREAERASKLSAQNIAHLYDAFEENGEIFLVMEYVEGQTLRHRLSTSMPLAEFFSVALQCVEALVAAHERQIVHRDIKPENIMLTPTGRVKILDFGVARHVPAPAESGDAATMDTREYDSSAISGTPAYMAPEVLLQQDTDTRADIFSMGILFYEALAGRHPFLASSVIATSDRILHEEPQPISFYNRNVPPELERIVAKMMAKPREERYATAADLLVDLKALARAHASGGPTPVHVTPASASRAAEGVAPRPMRWPAPTLLLAAAVVLPLLALLAVLLVPTLRERLFRPEGGQPALPGTKNVAVLPFKAIGESAQSQAYCDGLTETLTVKLTQLTAAHALQVVPSSEVRTRRVSSPEEARRELGVNLVLQGTYHQVGENVRVNFALVDTSTLRQVRADSFDLPLRDPFAVEERVVSGSLDMLGIRPGPADSRVLAAHGTQVSTAQQLYTEARGYLLNYDKPENIEQAIGLFQRALDLDPNFAQARAGLGDAYWQKFRTTKQARWVPPARAACERSLALAPGLAAGEICLARIETGTGKYEAAVQRFQRALEIEPTNDEAYRGLADAYDRLNRPDDAEKTYRRAIELRPNYWAGYNWLGAFYFNRGRYADAAKMFTRVVELAPENARGHNNLGGAMLALGRQKEAIVAFEKSLSIRPNANAASNLGTLYFFFQDDYARAAKAFEQALTFNSDDYTLWGNLGAARKWAGDAAGAHEAYQKAAALAEAARKLNPRDAKVLADLAEYYASLDDPARAKPLIERALNLAPDNHQVLFQAAVLNELYFQQRDAALRLLSRAVKQNHPWDEIERSPALRHLRDDPRFAELRPKK